MSLIDEIRARALRAIETGDHISDAEAEELQMRHQIEKGDARNPMDAPAPKRAVARPRAQGAIPDETLRGFLAKYAANAPAKPKTVPRGDEHTESFSQEDPIFATNERLNPESGALEAPMVSPEDLLLLGTPAAMKMVPRIAQKMGQRGGLNAVSRVEPRQYVDATELGLKVPAGEFSAANSMNRLEQMGYPERAKGIAEYIASTKRSAPSDTRQMEMFPMDARPSSSVSTQWDPEIGKREISQALRDEMHGRQMGTQGSLDLSRMRQGRPEFLENAPEGLYYTKDLDAVLRGAGHDAQTMGPSKDFFDRLGGPQYAGRSSTPLPSRQRLAGGVKRNAIPGRGGPEGLYNTQSLQDLLGLASHDVKVMGAKPDYDAQMRQLAAEIDAILRSTKSLRGKGKPQTTVMNPHTGAMVRDIPQEFSTGGKVDWKKRSSTVGIRGLTNDAELEEALHQ
jgi:hypothetical protein